MATALDLITGAAVLLNAISEGESLTATEADYGLTALNDMLESWTTDRMFVYQLAKYQYTWPGGVISQTVGAAGDIPITRPVAIDQSYVNQPDNQSYVLKVITRRGYDNIGLKTLQTNIPEWIYYDPGFPLGTLYLYPVPGADIPLFLNYWLALPSFSSLTDPVSLPPGYKRAITFSLAIDLAAYFGVNVPAVVNAVASSATAKIKRLNSPDIQSELEVAYNPTRYAFNIFRGF